MITLTNLRKVYHSSDGEVTALDGITLTVPDGVIHGIVGPSGAGKSTLIRCLTALEPPDEGSIVIDDQELVGLRPDDLRRQRRRIGMVFQDVNLLDARTALANVAYPLRVAGKSRREADERARQLLDLVGLGDRAKAYPAHLSGGQRQRVGIARALAGEPSVLLCDEPSSALDWETTRHILELIRQVRDRLGLTVLIITHEMSVVRQVCDSVTLLSHGRIVQSGRVADVIADHGSRLARSLIPLPETPIGVERAQLELSSSTRGASIDTVMRLLLAEGDDVHVQAGTIETIDGERIGRFQVSVIADRRDAVIARLRQGGVYVEVVDETEESDVPWDAADEQEDVR
ncbi:MAG: ATP-binding cassette domain-containing protein [Propionibacteriaceae bacterium]|nr:ATP-binding cassette domain-containing protein [Propionibacteriaceae bacterium]